MEGRYIAVYNNMVGRYYPKTKEFISVAESLMECEHFNCEEALKRGIKT